jgi:hypothetical protein
VVSDGLDRPPASHNLVTSDHSSVSSSSHVNHDDWVLSDAKNLLDAQNKTKSYGTHQCRQFRKEIFESHSQYCLSLASNYAHIADRKNYIEANLNLLSIDQRLKIADINFSCDKTELKTKAQYLAEQNLRISIQISDPEKSLAECSKLPKIYGISLPEESTVHSMINRLCCCRWWKRKLFGLQRQILESVARDIGMVHHHTSTYSSVHSQRDRADQIQATQKYLENSYLINDQLQTFSLKELYEKSVSNPLIRRSELMLRIKGFEMVAERLGDIGEFYTITCPSRMHARFKKTGRRNPKYDGTNPRQAQQYLNLLWSRIRAKLDRDGIPCYGFRVAEPNHDGTPHWHMLLFMQPEYKSAYRKIVKKYALEDSPNEKGAKKSRFKAVAIDKGKGSAAGYIAKYIAKNIDGSHINKDLYGNDAKQAANAIDTWSSVWGIRQFQQIGGPSVTVWRELRRIANSDDLTESCRGSLIGDAAFHAGASDFAAFVMVMGGPHMRRTDQPIKILYVQPEYVDKETGEFIEGGLTRYGDVTSAKIKGLLLNGVEFITRLTKWQVVAYGELSGSGGSG